MGFEGRPSDNLTTDRDARIRGVLEDIIRRRENGEVLDERKLRQDHPDLMPELLERVSVLHRLDQAHQTALQSGSGATDSLVATTPPRWPKDSIPGYALKEQIQRGGQAVLYRARQEATGREVAIKVMHEGPLVGPRDRARFDREVRVLAHLRHPNIVPIHDSGYVDECRFFVMDYIAGHTLEEYLVRHPLDVNAILHLFAKILRPVHAAHLRGIIHRDLKPANLLIDSQGEPHVLDFGLAKIATEEINEATEWRQMTLTGQFVGTLPWASPEQADGPVERVDLRTDIYSLGVILYHMLSGRFPYPVAGRMQEVVRHILETAPTRLTGGRNAIDEDVETIILKCLAKEPERRYQSVAALIDDIERYLLHQPILARSPSAVYQLKKLVRRHRLAVVLLTIVVAVSTGSAIVMGVFYQRAARDRNRAASAEAVAEERRAEAEASAETARFTREFLIADVIGVDLWAVGGRDSTIGEALEHAAQRLRESPPKDEQTRAALNHSIGSAYLARGQGEAACPFLEDAIDGYSRARPPSEYLFGARMALAEALFRKGDTERGAELAAETWEEAKDALGGSHETTVGALKVYAHLRWSLDQDQKAAVLVETAAARCSEALSDDHLTCLGARSVLAAFVRPWQGRTAEAVTMLRGLLETYRQVRGEESQEALSTEAHLGPMLRDQGYLAEAEPLLARTHDRFVRVFGEESGPAIGAAIQLAILRRAQSRLADAADLLEHAASAAERGFGVDDPNYQSSIQYLASVYGRQGRLCKAGPMAEELLESRRRTLGPDHIATCTSEVELAATYYTIGRLAEAEPLVRHAFLSYQASERSTSVNTLWAKLWLERILVALGREDEALPLAEEVIAARKEHADAEDAEIQDVLYYARELLDIEPQLLRDPRRALEYLEAIQADDPADAIAVDHRTAIACAQLGNYDRAIAIMERVLQMTPWENSQARDQREDLLVAWYRAVGDSESGVTLLRSTLDQREQIDPAGPDALHARLRLAEALIDEKRFEETQTLLGSCTDFRGQFDECLWHGAKCRALRVVARAALGIPPGVGESVLANYQDLTADPWLPEVERKKASRRVIEWLLVTFPR
jgi:tetratricopeptide (TPR) repeat protein